MDKGVKYALGAVGIFIAGGLFSAVLMSSFRAKDTEATLKEDVYRYAGVTEETTQSAPQTQAETAAQAAAPESSKFTVTAAPKGAPWAEGDLSVQEIEFIFTNNSDTEVTDWTGTIEFDTEVKGINSWNDTFTYEGKKVGISPIEWNKAVKPGESKTINFHLKTALPVSVVNASVSTDAGSGGMAQPKAEEEKAPAVVATPEDPSKTPVGQHGKLSVSGTQIVDKNGAPIILQGVSTHGIAWFPQYVDKEGFRTLRDTMGVNTIRLALYSSAGEGYTTAMHQKVAAGVEYAKELGMYVIIDWHILANGNPNTDKAAAKNFFTEMTGKFKDCDNVIYEICNEPNGGTTWENDIKPYANEMISLIRQQDDDAIIIVGTPTWSQDVDVVSKSPITGQKNIMYALHFYSATHKQDLRNKLATALNAGLPVFVTEFGISEASGAGNIDENEGTTWINYLRQKGVSYVCWNLSNKNEACALIKSNVTKTSGWTDDDLTQEGKWLKKTYTTK